jgi:hypothetical protein
MSKRSFTAWLRPALTLLGLAGVLTLAACGGGSGAPNNPYVPPTPVPVLSVQPLTLTAYSGVPVTVSITSGAGPFQAFSSNSTILPVSQNVAGNTVVLLANQAAVPETVIVTIQDAVGGTQPVSVTVQPAPIFNALTFAPSGSDCGSDLCSGQAGTATVRAAGPSGTPLAGRQIRFDVIYGPIGLSTTNPATPLSSTITIATDSTGTAVARVVATANATTQPAQIRATDVTSGQQQIANFTVVNNTVAQGSPITVVPATVNIVGPTTTACSTGFRIDYYVYGGNPPYTVSSTFPASVTLVNNIVPNSGGFFEAITNGSCVNPLQFTIVDSAGKQTTAQLTNVVGTTPPPVAPPFTVSPGAVAANSCSGKTFTFLATGGTAPYNAYVSGYAGMTAPNITPNVVAADGGTFAVTITAPEPVNGATTIVVGDSTLPARSQTVTITCTAPATPVPPAVPPLVVNPLQYDWSVPSTTTPPVAGTCVGKTSVFSITGGTPPYTASFSTTPPAGAVIAPSTIPNSGGGFSVTGLPDQSSGGFPVTNVAVRDSSASPQLVQVVGIRCP